MNKRDVGAHSCKITDVQTRTMALSAGMFAEETDFASVHYGPFQKHEVLIIHLRVCKSAVTSRQILR